MMMLGAASLALFMATGCKSYWIESSVDNQTGEAIHELEVDYPTASFGTNKLAPGASMRYRFQVRGSGPVKVEYTSESGKLSRAQGLTLNEHQHGQLLIRLLPAGKVEFSPKLEPAS